MANKICEKCIHYEMCKAEMDLAPDDTFTFFPYNEDCPHFKNKSDYAEVKHGEWEKFEIPHMMRCSECGVSDLDIHRTKFDFCPYCGAKMDGTPKERGAEIVD